MQSDAANHNILWSEVAAAQPVGAPEPITPELIARFWRKVAMNSDSECWLWKGNTDRLGYGQFFWAGKPRRAHRVAYYIWNYEWFGPDVKLRHTCDVRRCCNPAHLIPGTQADNMRDRKLREGYRTMRRGEEHRRAKLTEEAVRDIRAHPNDGTADSVLSARYGISSGTVSKVRRGKLWSWLPQEP